MMLCPVSEARCTHSKQALLALCRTGGSTDYGISGHQLNAAVAARIQSAEHSASPSAASMRALVEAAVQRRDVPVVVHHQAAPAPTIFSVLHSDSKFPLWRQRQPDWFAPNGRVCVTYRPDVRKYSCRCEGKCIHMATSRDAVVSYRGVGFCNRYQSLPAHSAGLVLYRRQVSSSQELILQPDWSVFPVSSCIFRLTSLFTATPSPAVDSPDSISSLAQQAAEQQQARQDRLRIIANRFYLRHHVYPGVYDSS